MHKIRPTTWLQGVACSALLITALALVSCAPATPSAAHPGPPPLGTLTELRGGGVRATGVVARYPVAGIGSVGYDWALYSALGSDTEPFAVVAALDYRLLHTGLHGPPSGVATDPLAPFDGRLVTVEGTLTPRFISWRGLTSPRSPWPRLEITSIVAAPSADQARIAWKDSLVQPGRWFDEPWRYALAQAYESVDVTGSEQAYRDLAAAEKAYGSRIPAPASPLVGRLVGVVLGPSMKWSWRIAYSSGLYVTGPAGNQRTEGQAWIYSSLRYASSSQQHLVHVNGRAGLVGETNGLGSIAHYIVFWDGGQVVSIAYRGLGSGPSEQDLISIAESMQR